MISNVRLIITLLLFLITFTALQFVQTSREVPIKRSLGAFPSEIDGWRLVDQRTLSDKVSTMLGVDDYIDYDYVAPDGLRLNLYVSYFGSVGTTGGYHSPRNCLPGGGWQIASLDTIPLKSGADEKDGSRINSMIIQNGGDRQLTLYWFQNRGRIIASEYWEKIYLVLDSIMKRRRDGSFIRIMAPFPEGKGMEALEPRLSNFAEKVASTLEDFLPGAEI